MLRMKPVRYLFVYGTLMSAFRNAAARAIRARSRCAGRATTVGRLYRIGRYPGLVSAAREGETVKGELYRIAADAAFWKRMDAYEGREYRRVVQPVRLETGETIAAWLFRYVRHVSPGRKVAGGDFLSVPHPVLFVPRWSRRS